MINSTRNSLIVYILLTIFTGNNNANAKEKYLEDRRELALQECLDINYESLGAYQTKELHDASFWTYKYGHNQNYSFDGIHSLSEFVKSNTGHFHKERLPLKYETDVKPKNAIFKRCMEFYKSRNLKKFLQKAPL